MMMRRPAATDAEALAVLVGEWGYAADAAAIREWLPPILASERDLLLVAEEKGAILGWVHAAEHRTLAAPPACEILGLVVGSASRRFGLGRLLMDMVVRWAASRGLDRLIVRSNVVRTESHGFYAALGFEHAKTQHVYTRATTTTAGSN